MSHANRVLLKVVLVGDQRVGKTWLANALTAGAGAGGEARVTDADRPYKETIGADFATIQHTRDGKNYTLQVWDSQGRSKGTPFESVFYRGADVLLLCYDVTSRQTL
jgi:small GTP-binding protein